MEAVVKDLFIVVTLFEGESWGAIKLDATLRPGMGTWAPKFMPRSLICAKPVFCATSDAFGVQSYMASKNE